MHTHNGGKYDDYILMNNKHGKLASGGIPRNGWISLPMYQGYAEFRDFRRLFAGKSSLAALCKDFELDIALSKTTFPHDFINSDTIRYIGPVPEEKFWPHGVIPREMRGIAQFDVQSICTDYLNSTAYRLGHCSLSIASFCTSLSASTSTSSSLSLD